MRVETHSWLRPIDPDTRMRERDRERDRRERVKERNKERQRDPLNQILFLHLQAYLELMWIRIVSRSLSVTTNTNTFSMTKTQVSPAPPPVVHAPQTINDPLPVLTKEQMMTMTVNT